MKLVPFLALLILFSCNSAKNFVKVDKDTYFELLENTVFQKLKGSFFYKIKENASELIKLDPDNPSGYLAYGLYYYDHYQPNYDSALYYFLLSEQKNEWASYYTSLLIAKCYRQLGKDSLELEYLNESIKRETYIPRDKIEFMYEKKMLPTKDTVLYILDRKDTARKERADWYWRHQQYDKAIADMDTIIMFRPSAENYFQKGLMYYKLGKYDQAVVAFDSAIHRPRRYMAKDKTKLYAYKASCLGKLGHYQEALQLYQRRIDGDCDSGLLYYLRGITYLDAGEPAKTCQDWEKAIELYYWKNGLLDKYKEMCE